MRIIENDRRIRVLGTVGRFVPWVALLVLGAGLVISYVRPASQLITVGAIVLGAGLSIIGGRLAQRYAGPLPHHAELRAVLKGLDSRHVLAQYVLPAPHVLLDPGGVTVLMVKSHDGEIDFVDGRFKERQKGRIFRQLAGQESIALAHDQALAQASKVEAWLENTGNSGVPVRAAIVFVNRNVRVYASDSPVPVFYGKKIKSWLRGPGKRRAISRDAYRQVADAIAARGSEVEG
jgi:hypothetical protein